MKIAQLPGWWFVDVRVLWMQARCGVVRVLIVVDGRNVRFLGEALQRQVGRRCVGNNRRCMGRKKKVDTYSTEISQYIASACKKKENNE